MTTTILIYDFKNFPVDSDQIEFEEQDEAGEVIAIASNSVILDSISTVRQGATFLCPLPIRTVIIWVDDKSLHYAPITLPTLNPAVSGIIPVMLSRLPDVSKDTMPTDSPRKGLPRPKGPLFDNPVKAKEFITRQVKEKKWSIEEGNGVRLLIDAINRARSLSKPSSEFQDRVARWVSFLRKLEAEDLPLSSTLKTAAEWALARAEKKLGITSPLISNHADVSPVIEQVELDKQESQNFLSNTASDAERDFLDKIGQLQTLSSQTDVD